MAPQSLRINSAFRKLDELGGKLSIEQITDELISCGAIDDNPEDYRAYQRMLARKIVGDYRKNKQSTGDVQNDLANLKEILEDGTTANYFKHCHEMTVEEAVQHVRYWDKSIAKAKSRRDRYYDFHLRQHGKKFQKLLAFDSPALPVGSN